MGPELCLAGRLRDLGLGRLGDEILDLGRIILLAVGLPDFVVGDEDAAVRTSTTLPMRTSWRSPASKSARGMWL